MKTSNDFNEFYLKMAMSILDRMKNASDMKDSDRLEMLINYLDNHTDIRDITDQIILVRNEPKATKSLIDKCCSITSKPEKLDENDISNLMLANTIFGNDNKKYLSDEALDVLLIENFDIQECVVPVLLKNNIIR